MSAIYMVFVWQNVYVNVSAYVYVCVCSTKCNCCKTRCGHFKIKISIIAWTTFFTISQPIRLYTHTSQHKWPVIFMDTEMKRIDTCLIQIDLPNKPKSNTQNVRKQIRNVKCFVFMLEIGFECEFVFILWFFLFNFM